MTDTITVPEGIDTLRAQFNGQVILPADPTYDERRAHFHTKHDKHPSVIVVPVGTADVVAAVKFARAADLEIAVSSGGKHPAGFSRTDGGIVIDLSAMRAVKVDSEEQTAWLQAGANGGDLQAEAGLRGFGGISGWMRGTGVGGVNLNGGFGTLSNKLGFGVDTILELELVTADGEVLRVSPEENPDLFWALRGAAPNFGVVTWIKQRLTPVPEKAVAGFLFYAAEDAPKVMGQLERLVLEAPDDLTIAAFISDVPEIDEIPAEMHGNPALSIGLVHIGDPEQAEVDLQPLRELGPKLDWVGPQSVFEFMCSMDEFLVPGRMHWDVVEVSAISEKVIDTVDRAAHSASETGLHFEITLCTWGKMRNPEFPNATPEGQDGDTLILVDMFWQDEADDERGKAWVDSVVAELREDEVVNDGWMGNVASFPNPERDRRSYGEENWKRLTELKAKYDPDNLFHLNHNIPPA
jgi:FAD/FMN-containing dehydrogenase